MDPPPVMTGVPRVKVDTGVVEVRVNGPAGLTWRKRERMKVGATSRVPGMVVVEPMVPMARAPPRELMVPSSALLARTVFEETVPVV